MRLTYLLVLVCMACGSGPTSYANLGGETDVPMGSAGQVISTLGAIQVGDETIDVSASATMVSNKSGLATFKVVADLTTAPRLKKWNDLHPASAKDSNGRVNTEVKFRITSEGIQDFFNKDGQQHTLVRYAAPVGESWPLTKSDGKTITRRVVARSDQDDFPYGFFDIKTMTIEQDSRVPGIRKFVYRANHRFGIVYFELVADDGSTMSVKLFAKNT